MIGALQYNVLLELVQVTEQYALQDYPDIRKELDAKLANVLNQQFEGIKEEFEEQAKELEQQKRVVEQAAEKASLSNIEMMKQFGITLMDEQVQAMLKHAEERKTEE